MERFINHVEGPLGFTRTISPDTIEVLVRMGVLEYAGEAYDIVDGQGRPVGDVVRYYRSNFRR